MKKVAWISALLALVVLGSLLAGCAKQEAVAPDAPAPMTPPPAASALSGEIKVKGSDTLLQLSQAWAEEFMKVNPNVMISVTGGGSGTGITALVEGTTDVANASRGIKDKEIAKAKEKNIEPVENIVAYDGIAVIVHKDNPVSELSIEQLKGIFSGATKDWSKVGGKGKIVVLSRDTSSGTHVFFKEHVLNGGNDKGTVEYGKEVLLQSSNQAIHDEVLKNPSSIGYCGLGYVDDAVKVIAVKADASTPGVQASIEAVKDKSYPIARALYQYTTANPSELVKALLDWEMGPEGQKFVADEGFVTLN